MLFFMTFIAPQQQFVADKAAGRLRLLPGQWPAEQAHVWYNSLPWLVGANYVPAYAINQIEMWQAEAFDLAAIDRELSWAEAIHMNTMRVFLHDMLWRQEPAGFVARVDAFLTLCAARGIRPMLVLFDSVWHEEPSLGPQSATPGVHNSGWVQGPGKAVLEDRSQWPQLEDYVRGIVRAFGQDPRVLIWDVWNEPDNGGGYLAAQCPTKMARVAELLPQVFAWVRAESPIQPTTCGVWHNPDWRPQADLSPIERIQLEQSDLVSFHNYEWPEAFEDRIAQLREWGRPLLCTEWLARSAGSIVETVLPIGKRERVAMFNWGFVAGKSQTIFPWDSWARPYESQPPVVWFHDLLQADGTPYRAYEAQVIRELARQP